MSWIKQTLSSSLGRKLLMALSGLFLILFLIIHLAGNLQLLINDNGEAFNKYTETMANSPLIKVASYVTYATFLLHIIYSVTLTIMNSKARPIKYAVNSAANNSAWNARNMGILGTIILIFLIIHLKGFWYELKFGQVATVIYEGKAYKNSYLLVKEAYGQWWYALLYIISMLFLSLHLAHGFKSAFQTLGLNHKKYTPIIEKAGLAYSIIVPGMFAAIPAFFLIKKFLG